jgi:hypothetical protein
VKPVALALLVLAVASPALAAPVVTSDSECPSAAEVTAQVANLWLGEPATSVAAHIRLNGEQMLIDLASDNEPVVTRGLPLESDCRSRAQAAALVITAWLDTVSADPVGLPPMVPPGPVRASSPRAAQTPPRSVPRMLLGAGGYASMDDQGAAALLSGEAVWPRLAGWLGFRAGLSFPLPRTMAVGQGRSRWWRPVLDLGVILPLHEGTWNLTASAGPALGLLVVAGKDFDRNQSDVVLSWGALVGIRLGYARARGSSVWAELRGLLWPGVQSIRNDVMGTAPRESALPRVEGHLGLGFSFTAL